MPLQEDPAVSAFANSIVIRNVFSCLSLESLKKCRFVSKTWNFEAASCIRNFRRCEAKISASSPCSSVTVLKEIVSQMTDVVFINSVTIRFSGFHSVCASLSNEENLCDELLKKLPLKYLTISWNSSFIPPKCCANIFLARLLREKLGQLRSLELDRIPEHFANYIPHDQLPSLPTLKIVTINVSRDLIQSQSMDFITRILNGAPNMKKIKWQGFHRECLQVFPKEKYALLDSVKISITTAEDATKWLRFAQARPSLSALTVLVPSYEERYHIGSFFRILEMLLSSSCKTLERLNIVAVNFPFTILKLPALVKLKKFWILSTELHQEHLIDILRSIDYPGLLPALEEVVVRAVLQDIQAAVDPWLYDSPVRFQLRPSTTVKSLTVIADFNTLKFTDLSQIFPKVTQLKTESLSRYPASSPYQDICGLLVLNCRRFR